MFEKVFQLLGYHAFLRTSTYPTLMFVNKIILLLVFANRIRRVNFDA